MGRNSWIRIDANRPVQTGPMRRAGFYGRSIQQALAELCAEKDLDGTVDLDLVTVGDLADRMQLDEALVEKGIYESVCAGIVKQSGSILVVDMLEFVSPETLRTRSFRSKHKHETVGNGMKRDETDKNIVEQNVTTTNTSTKTTTNTSTEDLEHSLDGKPSGESVVEVVEVEIVDDKPKKPRKPKVVRPGCVELFLEPYLRLCSPPLSGVVEREGKPGEKLQRLCMSRLDAIPQGVDPKLFVEEYFNTVKKSHWLMYECSCCNFRWLLSPETWTKVVEGFYSKRKNMGMSEAWLRKGEDGIGEDTDIATVFAEIRANEQKRKEEKQNAAKRL